MYDGGLLCCRAGEDFGGALVVAASDWSIIPAENLVAAFQNSSTKVSSRRKIPSAFSSFLLTFICCNQGPIRSVRLMMNMQF